MIENPTILAFDTALFGCSVAVLNGKTGICTSESKPMSRGQAEQLVPMIETVIKTSNCDFDEIDVIGTTVGPGAFTGLRIGLATARALSLALGKPVIGVTTLEALARQYKESQKLSTGQHLAVIIETKRKDFYFQCFNDTCTPETLPEALAGTVIYNRIKDKNTVVIGDASNRFRQEHSKTAASFEEAFSLIDPTIIATLTKERFAQSEEFKSPEPLYLRPADVSQPKRKPRVLID